jgi:hypothetical protein
MSEAASEKATALPIFFQDFRFFSLLILMFLCCLASR